MNVITELIVKFVIVWYFLRNQTIAKCFFDEGALYLSLACKIPVLHSHILKAQRLATLSNTQYKRAHPQGDLKEVRRVDLKDIGK